MHKHIATLIIAAVAATTLGVGIAADEAVQAASHRVEASVRPACRGSVVVHRVGQPFRCDVSPPQRLTLLGLTRAECLDAGGVPQGRGTRPPCRNADY